MVSYKYWCAKKLFGYQILRHKNTLMSCTICTKFNGYADKQIQFF